MPTHEQIVASAVEAFNRTSVRPASDEKPEEGYFSAKQWCEMTGLKSAGSMKASLDHRVTLGVAEKKSYRINGRPIDHYKIKS